MARASRPQESVSELRHRWRRSRRDSARTTTPRRRDPAHQGTQHTSSVRDALSGRDDRGYDRLGDPTNQGRTERCAMQGERRGRTRERTRPEARCEAARRCRPRRARQRDQLPSRRDRRTPARRPGRVPRRNPRRATEIAEPEFGFGQVLVPERDKLRGQVWIGGGQQMLAVESFLRGDLGPVDYQPPGWGLAEPMTQ